jgi:hypothetical protein
MEESSMQQCGFLLYSWEMVLAKTSKMMVNDGTMLKNTGPFEIFRKKFK